MTHSSTRQSASSTWFRRPPLPTLAILAAGLLLIAAMLAHDAYTAFANAALIRDLPPYPGAEEVARYTSPDSKPGAMPAPRGWVTVHYRVPSGTTADDIRAFYEPLGKLGDFEIPFTTVGPGDPGPRYIVYYLCRGDAYIRIDAHNVQHSREYRIAVDHNRAGKHCD